MEDDYFKRKMEQDREREQMERDLERRPDADPVKRDESFLRERHPERYTNHSR